MKYMTSKEEKINWITSIPYILIHLMPLGVFFTGITWFSVGLCVTLYVVRMFFVTAGYHRYFAHRSYKLGRVTQFIMALGGTLAVQKGPLWWAAHHRNHHQYSDTELDVHSPVKGLFWSHMGWVMCDKYNATQWERVQDFAKYPELRWLNKYALVFPAILGTAIFFLWGPAALFIGFFLSTVLQWHVTYMINSMAHKIGGRRYVTNDTSRNFLPLAILTGGEGWHNNHHYFSSSANQGFFWWEIDWVYYVLKVLSWVGIVKDLRNPPKEILKKNRVRDGILDIGMFQEHWRQANHVLDKTRKGTQDYYRAQKKALTDAIEHQKEALAHAMEHTKQNAQDLVRVSKGAVKTKSE